MQANLSESHAEAQDMPSTIWGSTINIVDSYTAYYHFSTNAATHSSCDRRITVASDTTRKVFAAIPSSMHLGLGQGLED